MAATKTRTNPALGYWNDKAQFFASGKRRQKNRRMADLYENGCWRYIEPLLPVKEGGTILEAGCGTGRWVFRLAPMGYTLELADFSDEMIRHAEVLVNQQGLGESVTNYHVLDICDMAALGDNAFDLVLALGMPLSLCSDPNQAVSELSRITKPGGHVVCDTMNRFRRALDLAKKNDMTQFLTVLNNGKVVADSGLTHYCFGPEELEALFREQGLTPCKTAAITPFLEHPPSTKQVKILDDDQMFNQLDKAFQTVAEEPWVLGLTSRLLMVAQKPNLDKPEPKEQENPREEAKKLKTGNHPS
ncbi:MAG: methyltransferase domain-containing protein [Desulfobacterium sp.]|nr:methyltransferase domain-containing protein [Desulfobacterium sp.]